MKLSFITIVFTTSLAIAQGSSSGLTQLKLPASARLAALGESLVAEPGDLGAVMMNPANLFRNERLALLLTHNQWIQELRSEHTSFGQPFSFGTVGLAISGSSIGGIEIRDRPGPALSTFTARSTALQLSFATSLQQQLVIGTSAKILYEKMYVDEATGVAIDVGLLYHLPVQGLVAGISLTNIGSTDALATETVVLPQQASLGASYRFDFGDFTLAVSSLFAREDRRGVNRFSTGFEAVFQNDLAFRVGYQTGYDARSLSAGLGVRYDILTFDYAYVPFSYNLGAGHLFTIGFII